MYTSQISQTISLDTVAIVGSSEKVKTQILPDRFGSISVPSPNGLVDFGPESSTPRDLPISQVTESYELVPVKAPGA